MKRGTRSNRKKARAAEKSTSGSNNSTHSTNTLAISPASSMPSLVPVTTNTINSDNLSNMQAMSSCNLNPSAIHIAPFDGTPEHISFFKQQVFDMANIFNWPDAFTLMFASGKLTGKALQYFREAQVAEPFTSTTDLFNRLSAFFQTSSVVQHIHDFESLVMLENEEIPHIVHRLNVTARRVYPNMSDEILKQIKFTKLIKIIPDNLRLAILQDSITTFDAAVAKATLVQQCTLQNNIITNSDLEAINAMEKKCEPLQPSVDNIPHNSPQPKYRHYHNNRRNFRRRNSNRHNNRHKFHQRPRNFFRARPSLHQQGTSFESSTRTDPCQFCQCFGHTARDCAFATFIMHNQQQRQSSVFPIENRPNGS